MHSDHEQTKIYQISIDVLQETLNYIAQSLPTAAGFPVGRVHNLILALQQLKQLTQETPDGNTLETHQ